MRVVAGDLRGRRLRAPRSEARPTQDRVREALFNILGARMLHARFLDLFAGSGAVGIEAISRGAARVSWVESDRQALAVLRQNVRTLGIEARGQVVPADVGGCLKNPEKTLAAAEFDIIFADPPYTQPEWESRLSVGLLAARLLTPDGVWIMESKQKTPEAIDPAWRCIDERRYGQTRLRFYALECRVPENSL